MTRIKLTICFLSIFIIAQAKQPNFVFILADDCTNWDIGCYGSKDSKTPNIDKFAAEGIKFNRCYQSAPMCSPTRHNIYTGLYPVKTGAYPNHTFAKEGTKSIVQHLKPLGYRVALSGKVHVAPKNIFDFEYLGNDKNPDFALVDSFLTVTQQNQEPFALMLCSNEPHTPWDKGDTSLFNPDEITLPPHYVDTKETRREFCKYLAEINYLDQQVGEAMALLEKHGVDENTLVIFASEQGNAFPFAKWTLYEAGVKSALIARFPGKINPGIQSDAVVEYNDILPTFIELAGSSADLDGKSLTPLFSNSKKDIKKYAFSLQTSRGIHSGSDYYGIRAAVNNQYRYIINLTPEAKFLNATNNGRHTKDWYDSWVEVAKTNEKAKKIVNAYHYRPKEELFDVVNDKWCLNNLANNAEYETVKNELKKALKDWMLACGDEGIISELLALQYMGTKKQKDVILISNFSEAIPEGNFSVSQDGYYTFYSKSPGTVKVDGNVLIENKSAQRKDIYGIIALKSGQHIIDFQPDTKISWSGPTHRKTKLTIE